MPSLEKYNKKRDFKKTKEPKGKEKKNKGKDLQFVVQKHDASRLHYDLRLEMEGVMKSWAVPKGPSLNPEIKRLAMQVEDHPISYNTFEGTIPKGQYGGGSVIVWDRGIYYSTKSKNRNESEKEFLEGLKRGLIHFNLQGEKLKGSFTLVKFKGKEKEWMLVKNNDEFATEEDITLDNTSVISNRSLIGKTENSKKVKKIEKVKPMMAVLVDKPFDDKDWIFEIKWDGYRALANIIKKNVELYSRNFQSFNEKFPKIVNKLKNITETVILDGEVIAYDAQGNVSFQELQNSESTERIEYMIFDILNLDGQDLTSLPQIERKQILKDFLKNYPELKESEYIEGEGKKFFEAAKERNLEGIMGKNKKSPYLGKRTSYWVKIKNQNIEEAIIVGFTEPRGSRKYFGALVLGVYKGKELIFAGHTGTGFDQETLKNLYNKMKLLVIKENPFKKKIPINSKVTCIKPILVAQIKFAEWTKDGIMRQAVFLGLREDKNSKEVIESKKIPVKEIKNRSNNEIKNTKLKVSNLDKVYFPKLKITKLDVINYYKEIAPLILPYLADRPETLNRHPNGIDKPAFFQKNFTTKTPEFVKTAKIHSESNDKEINYLICNNLETLLYMTNLGCIEINPWNSKIGSLHSPDYMIFDLDPRGSTWTNLIKVAKTLKEILDISKQDSYIKTSGKAGLHIYVPLGGKYDFENIRNFSHLICQIINKKLPLITSLERDPKKRKNMIYLDYLQNRIGQTTASVYSLRPVSSAAISTPIKWSELNTKLDPSKFNINTIKKRIKKVGDIWKPVIKNAVDLGKAIQILERKFEI